MSRMKVGIRGTRSPASIGGLTIQYLKNRGRTYLTGIDTLPELLRLLHITPVREWPPRPRRGSA